MKYYSQLLAVMAFFSACGEGVATKFQIETVNSQFHSFEPVQSNETNPRKLIANFDLMSELDARNGYLTWVKCPREPVYTGGKVYVADMQTMNTRLVTSFGSSPAVDEEGRVGYAVVLPQQCTKIMVEEQFVATNCNGSNSRVSQMTTTSFNRGLFVFTMKRNQGTPSEAMDDLLFIWRGEQSLSTVNQFIGSSFYRPRIHGDEIGFMQWNNRGVEPAKGVIFNLLNGSFTNNLLPGNLQAIDFDFGGRWSTALTAVWQKEEYKGMAIWTMDRLTGKARQTDTVESAYRIFINDEGTIIMWMYFHGTDNGFRIMKPKIDFNEDWKVSESYKAREAVLDGRDIYYIAPDETGRDALYVYKVP